MEGQQVVIRRSFEILERTEVEGERLVTGIVADPENVDSFGNKIGADVIRRAAFGFMERFGNMGVDHQKDDDGNPIVLNDKIWVVESWITREEGIIGGKRVPQGAWVLTSRVADDDIWQDVVDGNLTGYSFEAIVVRVPLQNAA